MPRLLTEAHFTLLPLTSTALRGVCGTESDVIDQLGVVHGQQLWVDSWGSSFITAERIWWKDTGIIEERELLKTKWIIRQPM
jgi:hypothetical protein